MRFDFVDIGTANFDTSLDLMKEGQNILLVEPIKYYLDQLPSGPNIYKVNGAISRRHGRGKMFYVGEELIKKYGMPDWIRGCNSFNDYHPTVIKLFHQLSISIKKISCVYVPVYTVRNLVKSFKITSIGFLKIDTEGHDHVILKYILEEMKRGLKVKTIKIEYNSVFGNTTKIDDLIMKSDYSTASLLEDNLTIDF